MRVDSMAAEAAPTIRCSGMTRLRDSSADRKWLRELYGLEFPDSLFALHEFLNGFGQGPAVALNAVGLSPAGPLELLMRRRADFQRPALDMVLHWRFYNDPPEFFTCLHGDTDGEHWGMLLDDPERGYRGVAAYFTKDVDDLRVYGGLLDAVLQRVDSRIEGIRENIEYDPGERAYYEKELSAAQRLGEELEAFIERERLPLDEARGDGVPSCTLLNAILPDGAYAPLSRPDEDVIELLKRPADLEALAEEATQLARRGFPGGALLLGRALHYFCGPKHASNAHRLQRCAYDALGRTELVRIVDTHHAHRDLRTVDIFHQ